MAGELYGSASPSVNYNLGCDSQRREQEQKWESFDRFTALLIMAIMINIGIEPRWSD